MIDCKNCVAIVTWDGRLWREADGRAHCSNGGLHVPDSRDVACCTPCIDGMNDPHYVQHRLQVLTHVPAGFRPRFDPTDNHGFTSRHRCDTCYREDRSGRRVVTLVPERPIMPANHNVLPTYESSTVFICIDCVTVVTQGPHPDDADCDATPLGRVPAGFHVIMGTEVVPFATARCGTCDTSLAGGRYEATLMSIEPTVCQQCVDLIRHVHVA